MKYELLAGALSAEMLAGAWGARAGELLEQAAERRGAQVHRVGELATLAPTDFVQAAGAAGCSVNPKTAAG